MKKRALFLDRDGVINEDRGYVHRPEDIEFLDGIFELVAEAKRVGYLVVIATNQSGIGRGYYTEADFHALTEWMKLQFIECGGQIDAVYFCPYHPVDGIGEYRIDSDCRKPAPGMFLKAQRELDIDMKSSVLIGDRPSDMQAGLAAGIGTCLMFCTKDEVPSSTSIHRLSDALSFIVPL